MIEDKPLPLARMATISRPSFWLFLILCLALYIYNKFFNPDNQQIPGYSRNEIYILMAVFTGLFLNLAGSAFKTPGVNRILNIGCYVFEIVSILVLGILIIIK
jgi:hypothetical protein